MQITIIGTGRVGSALGTSFAEAGHEVVFGSRDPDSDDVQALVEGIDGEASAKPPAEAAAQSDTVVLAVPGSAVVDVAADLADELAGRVVIDPTNTLDPGESSLAEQVAEAVPDAHVAKAFNTIGAEGMRNSMLPDGRASMFVCGDDEARATALDFAVDIEFYPIDSGDLSAAMHLENLGRFWIHLSRLHGRDIGFRLLGT